MEDQQKLYTVLEHWIEHNENHLGEYRKWAQKAGELGLAPVKQEIDEAMTMLSRLNERLEHALHIMKPTP